LANAPTAAEQSPQLVSAKLLVAQSLAGRETAFADLLESDGKRFCYTFLHPTCQLAQWYAPVLAELDKEFDE
jgi:hypothetical protein